MNFAQARVDAEKLLAMLPADVARPTIIQTTDGEVVMDWCLDERKASVRLDGDGMFGIALHDGRRYVPASMDGDLSRPETLAGLVGYLRGAEAEGVRNSRADPDCMIRTRRHPPT